MIELLETIKQNKGVLIFAVIAFIGLICFWLNSPMYQKEMAYKHQQAADFLRANSWQLPESDRLGYMEAFGITSDEIKEPLGQYIDQNN